MNSLPFQRSITVNPRNNAVVFSDFDGTITTLDTSVFLLERFGSPAWREIEDRMLTGEMTEMEGYAEEIDSIRVSKENALKAILDSVSIDPAFPEFIDRLEKRGFPFIILSGGIDFIIETVLAKYNLPRLEIRANSAHIDGDRWKLVKSSRPRIRGLCNHCKTHSVLEAGQNGGGTIYIGDGLTDRCPAEKADIVFAKGELAEHCRAEKIPFTQFTGFADILDEMEKL